MNVGIIIACIVPSLLLIVCLGFTLDAAAKTWGRPKTKIRRPVVSLDAVCVTAECTRISQCIQSACTDAKSVSNSDCSQKSDCDVGAEKTEVCPFCRTRFVSPQVVA